MIITHITTAHPRFDTRIFHKMCISSKISGHETTLIVADGLGSAEVSGVNIIDIGKPRSRFGRMFLTSIKAVLQARKLESQIYHLHDPELIPYVHLFESKSHVIFDFHEDVRQQILRKHYIPKFLKNSVSYIYSILESFFLKFYSGIVCATEGIALVYSEKSNKVIVRNYPLLEEFEYLHPETSTNNKIYSLVYIGGITEGRGVATLVDALEYITHDVQLHLCGPIRPAGFEAYLRSKVGWKNVVYHGNLDREPVVKILREADIGYVTLLPDPSYEEALPVKMFEYFASSVAVIASDFPIWVSLIEKDDLGIVVNPNKVHDIVAATELLLTNDEERLRLVNNGRKVFFEKYRWDFEYIKLNEFYKSLL